MIQQSIQTNTEGYLRELSGIQYMRALALIYCHSPWVLGNPSWIRSQIEKESESQKESQNASVGRSGGRPTLVHGRPPGRLDPNREQFAFSRSTGRSTGILLCTLCTPVDRAVDRPSPSVVRAVDRELSWPDLMHFSYSFDF